ncbi:MAG: glycosyltransferase family 9 protein [Thermodesulfobacteriota bacterium]
MNLKDAHRILVCLRYGIGDMIMEMPVLQTLRETAPQARITALGAAPAVELLEHSGLVDKIAVVQDFGLTHWMDPGSPKILADIHQWLDLNRFDAALDISHAVEALRTVFWEREDIFLMDTLQMAGEDPVLTRGGRGQEALRRAIAEGWGMRIPSNAAPRLFPIPEEAAWAEAFLADQGLTPDRTAAVSPVGSSRLKRWPEERFAQLADMLIEEQGFSILIPAGPQLESAEAVRGAMRHRGRTAVVGAIHLRRVSALLARCGLLVCNDTGLMHMAGAVNTPVVGIFGPTEPAVYLPESPTARAVQAFVCPYRKRNTFGPSDCIMMDHCFRGDPCIQAVTPESVTAAVREVIHPLKRRAYG